MKTLFCGFCGKNNTSSHLISLLGGETLLLTNSVSGLKRDIEALSDNYEKIILFGIDKNLKNSFALSNVQRKRASSFQYCFL